MDERLSGLGVNKAPLYQQVAEQIQNLIMDGGLLPGDRLPPERELGEHLGVSRTVIREAIKALQERGLVRAVSGSGTYVESVTPEAVEQCIELYMRRQGGGFGDLQEVRRILEVEIAGLAAERAEEDDTTALESVLLDMLDAFPDIWQSEGAMERYIQGHMRFHRALAHATKNVLLEMLLLPILDQNLEYNRASTSPAAAEPGLMHHERLLECVRLGNGDACREVMREHMDYIADSPAPTDDPDPRE